MNFIFYQLYVVFFLSFVITIAFIVYWFCYRSKEQSKKMIMITNQLEDTPDSSKISISSNSIYYNGSRTLTPTEISQLQLLTKSASQSTSSNKLLQEQFYEAQCVDNHANYINYLVNPVPSYEEIAEDLKIERPVPLSTPIYQFDTNRNINSDTNTDTNITINTLNNNNKMSVEVVPSPLENNIIPNNQNINKCKEL